MESVLHHSFRIILSIFVLFEIIYSLQRLRELCKWKNNNFFWKLVNYFFRSFFCNWSCQFCRENFTTHWGTRDLCQNQESPGRTGGLGSYGLECFWIWPKNHIEHFSISLQCDFFGQKKWKSIPDTPSVCRRSEFLLNYTKMAMIMYTLCRKT